MITLDKLGNYKIILKINNEVDFLEAQEILIKNGFTWCYCRNNLRNYDSSARFILFYIEDFKKYIKVFYSISQNTMNNVNYIEKINFNINDYDELKYTYIENISTLKNLFNNRRSVILSYNEPKKLIYEKNKTNTLKLAFYFIDGNAKKSGDIQELAFKNGYKWIGDTYPKYFITRDKYIVFADGSDGNINNYNKILYCSSDNENEIVSKNLTYYKINEEDILITSNISELSKFMGIKPSSFELYNKPKELIYESNNDTNSASDLVVYINNEEEMNNFKMIYENTYPSNNDDDLDWGDFIYDMEYHFNSLDAESQYPRYIFFNYKTGSYVGCYSQEDSEDFNFPNRLYKDEIYDSVYDGTYKYVYDFSKNIDIYSFKQILKEKKILTKPAINYNKPKELVYENLKNKKRFYIYKIKSKEDSTNAQLLGFNYNYTWGDGGKKIENLYDDAIALFFDNGDNSITYLTNSYGSSSVEEYIKKCGDEEEYNERNIAITDKLNELESLFKYDIIRPNYDNKQLIYEKNNEINNALFICILVNNQKEFEELKECYNKNFNETIGDMNFYDDSTFPRFLYINFKESYMVTSTSYILDNDYRDKNIKNVSIGDLYQFEEDEEDNVDDYVYNTFFDLSDINDKELVMNILNTKTLIRLRKPNYNTSKELVYENKLKIVEKYNSKEEASEIFVIVNNIDEINKLKKIYFNAFQQYANFDEFTNPQRYNLPIILSLHFKSFNGISWTNTSSIEGKQLSDIYWCDKVYEKIFNFSKLSDIIQVTKIITSHKIINTIPDYNTPKELVYENNNDKLIDKIEKYHNIHIKCNSDYEVIYYQKFLYKIGINWRSQETEPKYTNRSVCYYLRIDTSDKTLFLSSTNYTEEQYREKVNYNDILLTTISEFNAFFKISPDYNTPKELIYENKLNGNVDMIWVRCNTNNDVINIQKFLFKNGYNWCMETDFKIRDYSCSECYGFEIRIKDKEFVYETGFYTYEELESVYQGFGTKVLYCENFKELKKIMNDIPDYNTPMKLVYETYNDKESAKSIFVIVHNIDQIKELKELLLSNLGDSCDIDFYINGRLHIDLPYALNINFKEIESVTYMKVNRLNKERILEEDWADYIYEKIFDYNNPSDVSQIKLILKTKTIKNIPDYNTPMKLVYEKLKRFNNF